jgi:hypothetical protein
MCRQLGLFLDTRLPLFIGAESSVRSESGSSIRSHDGAHRELLSWVQAVDDNLQWLVEQALLRSNAQGRRSEGGGGEGKQHGKAENEPYGRLPA